MNIEDTITNYNKKDLLGLLHNNVKINNDFMYKQLNSSGGFDDADLKNGKQNNYAWCMCDFNGYIYVGTGRNLPLLSFSMNIPGVKSPTDYNVEEGKLDMCAEIWRYKKDGSMPWQRVYKSKYIDIPDKDSGEITKIPEIVGFRSMIKFNSFNLKPALYVTAYSIGGVKVLKSVDGCNWFDIKTNITDGKSSRAIIEYNGKLYMAVMNDGEQTTEDCLLYSSDNPELSPWERVTEKGEEGKNPIGTIWSMAEFNDRLYLGTSSRNGFMVWRTNEKEPKKDDWTLVMDKGGGDAKNAIAMTLTPFKNYLYVGSAYDVSDPMLYVVPKGAEIFRLDKQDKWELVVGGIPREKTNPLTGIRNHPLSNFSSGFNNPYNVYIWQITSHNGKLYVGTYDSSASTEPTLELFLLNENIFKNFLGDEAYNLSVKLLLWQVKFLSCHKQLLGFELYESTDGENFELISYNGFENPRNYGVRSLIVSDDNKLYLGTANPFEGCSLYKLYPSSNCKCRDEWI